MKGSPGGILILAVGAILLSLGWSGRYPAVWEALRTGKSESLGGSRAVIDSEGREVGIINGSNDVPTPPRPDGEPGSIPGNLWTCAIGSYAATTQENLKGTWRCYKPDDVQFATNIQIQNGFECKSGWTKAYVLNHGDAMPVCVRGSGVNPVLIGGGQVVDERDKNINILPNGAMSVMNQPNSIGLFNVDYASK